MSEPSTVNTGFIIPNTGDLPGAWGSTALNPDFVALDGYFGGVTTIAVAASPVTLTAPAGFTPTPSAGPTQAQNAILKFTGTLTANVQITLPLPGYYIITNQTTGNFVLSFRAVGTGQVIGVDQQDDIHIYNDGTNVRFVNLGRIGSTEMWAGRSAMPAWVTACTKLPYLLCDGSVYNFADYPSLAAKLGGAFGGNGTTTFAVPDSRGRIQLPYDSTGTRITAAGCGLNGQTMGGVLDQQTITLTTPNLPSYTPAGTISASTSVTVGGQGGGLGLINGSSSGSGFSSGGFFPLQGTIAASTTASFTGTAQGGTSTPVNNVQPSQVTGIQVIRAG